jgi:hypothetical protein
MFANLEITDRGLLHKTLARTADEVTMDEREVWARAIDGAVSDATRSSIPARNRVARPSVVLGAAPALSAVAALLRDEDVSVSRATIDAVRTFMTDGIASPLYAPQAPPALCVFVHPRRAARRQPSSARRRSRNPRSPSLAVRASARP